MDGLWAALQILEDDFDIRRLNLSKPKEFSLSIEDFILGWGAFGGRVHEWVKGMPNKKGLCIAGNAFPPDGANNYDVLFYETKWYRPQINFHKHIVHAFGINSDLYNQPLLPFPIVWDYLGVGAFANWKRWNRMTEKKGIRMVVGEMQDQDFISRGESVGIATQLLMNGVQVSNMVHPFDLSNMYHWSRTLYMPSDINGGGERAVLEARACGLQVEIEPDNEKLKELLDCPVYDEQYYAHQLKKGILECLI